MFFNDPITLYYDELRDRSMTMSPDIGHGGRVRKGGFRIEPSSL